MDDLRKTVEKGRDAESAEKYIACLIKEYREDILKQLERGDQPVLMQGMAVMLKRLEQDIRRDIAHGIDAQKQIKEKNNGKY